MNLIVSRIQKLFQVIKIWAKRVKIVLILFQNWAPHWENPTYGSGFRLSWGTLGTRVSWPKFGSYCDKDLIEMPYNELRKLNAAISTLENIKLSDSRHVFMSAGRRGPDEGTGVPHKGCSDLMNLGTSAGRCEALTQSDQSYVCGLNTERGAKGIIYTPSRPPNTPS